MNTTITYSIENSEIAFHALTTSLYQDRIRAPIREILSNAIDSHKRVNNQGAIDIKVPNSLDGEFSIRDYGTGLSKQAMLDLYTNLFSSDKKLQRENEVGGFGVGAKSPFAYTDSFTVESFYNGERSVYTAYLDGFSTPQLLTLMTEPTTEPNGLKVSYPIEKKDQDQVRNLIAQEIKTCAHEINIIGALAKEHVLLENDPAYTKLQGCYVGPSIDNEGNHSRSLHSLKVFIRMGSVKYPLPDFKDSTTLGPTLGMFKGVVANLRDNDYFQNTNDKAGRTESVIIDIPIGSAIPAMSREELVWEKEATVNAVATVLNDMLIKMLDEAKNNSDFNKMFRPGSNRSEGSYLYENIKSLGRSTTNPQLKEAIATWFAAEKKYAADRQVLMENGFAIHPGFLHHMHAGPWGHRNIGSYKGNGYEFGEDLMHMSLGALMPLSESFGRHSLIGRSYKDDDNTMMIPESRQWNSATGVTIMTPSRTTESLHQFYQHHAHGHFSHGRGPGYGDKKKGKSVFGKLPLPKGETFQYWLTTLMKAHEEFNKLPSNKKAYGGYEYSGHSTPIIMFAQDDAHVKMLLDLATKEGKRVALFDIENEKMEIVGQEPLEVQQKNQIWTSSVWDSSTQAWIEHTGEEPKYWCSDKFSEQGMNLLQDLARTEGFTLHVIKYEALKEFKPESRTHNISKKLCEKIDNLINTKYSTHPESKEQFYLLLAQPGMNYAKWTALLHTIGRFQQYYDFDSKGAKDWQREAEFKKEYITELPSIPMPEYPLLSNIRYDDYYLDNATFTKSLQQYIEMMNTKLGLQTTEVLATAPTPQ